MENDLIESRLANCNNSIRLYDPKLHYNIVDNCRRSWGFAFLDYREYSLEELESRKKKSRFVIAEIQKRETQKRRLTDEEVYNYWSNVYFYTEEAQELCWEDLREYVKK